MVYRRDLLAVITSAILAGCSAVEVGSNPQRRSEEQIRNEAQSPRWEELFRDNSDWESEPINYTDVEVVDIYDTDESFNLIIKHPDYPESYDGSGYSEELLLCQWNGDPFQQGDIVSFYGIVRGTQPIYAGELIVPKIDLTEIYLV